MSNLGKMVLNRILDKCGKTACKPPHTYCSCLHWAKERATR